MSSYRKGYRFEGQVIAELSGLGYDCQRAGASKGICDLMCVRLHEPDRILYVSCKRNGVKPPAEWNAHLKRARRVGATPLVAKKEPHGPIEFMKITGPKSGQRVRQPWEVWEGRAVLR